MNSSVLSGARVGYAMARDGIFFKIVEGIHPKFRTPGRSLIFQGILAGLMASPEPSKSSPIFLFLPPGFFTDQQSWRCFACARPSRSAAPLSLLAIPGSPPFSSQAHSR